MKTKLTLLAFALTIQPSFAQEAPPFRPVLIGREVQIKMEDCRTALERGQLLKVDETGAYHLFLSPLLFIIKVDEMEMTCRAYRHVFEG